MMKIFVLFEHNTMDQSLVYIISLLQYFYEDKWYINKFVSINSLLRTKVMCIVAISNNELYNNDDII